jgi:hypothetical protein
MIIFIPLISNNLVDNIMPLPPPPIELLIGNISLSSNN